MRPDTLRLLNPARSADEIAGHLEYSDFTGFLNSFVWVVRHLERPEHYALAARRLFDELVEQGVTYAEVTLSAGVVLWRRQPLDEIWDALYGASQRPDIAIRWIPDAVRQFGPDAALPVAEFAAARRHQGVVAFGIGGDEVRGPAAQFREIFTWARQQGLNLVAHAGEAAGPESIWQALKIGAQRIGHGIRAIDDPVLVEHLARHRIPLEVCVSSNLATGAVAALDQHPLRRLFDAGVPIVLDTDDPGMFHTWLDQEFAIARDRFGFTHQELEAIRRNAFDFAFDRTAASAGSLL
jgi:aminodeoxyfutalosine deaminase